MGGQDMVETAAVPQPPEKEKQEESKEREEEQEEAMKKEEEEEKGDMEEMEEKLEEDEEEQVGEWGGKKEGTEEAKASRHTMLAFKAPPAAQKILALLMLRVVWRLRVRQHSQPGPWLHILRSIATALWKASIHC